MSDDPELDALRAKLRNEMMREAAREDEPPAEPAAGEGPLDHPVEITDGEFQSFVAAHEFVVVDCWAPWCGPCRIVGPIVDQLAKEMAGKVAFAKLNVDHNPRVPGTFGVQGIPTLLVFHKGRLVDRIVGAMPKAQLAATLERMHAGAARRASGTPGPRRI